jgi:uracil-DNA glycosylase
LRLRLGMLSTSHASIVVRVFALVTAVVTAAGCANEEVDSEREDVASDEAALDARSCTTLPAASRELCELIPNNGWRGTLKGEYTKPYFERLARNVHDARAQAARSSRIADQVYPPAGETFAALEATPPKNIKVVIVGQDPYVEKGQANGLGFGVNPGVDVPPSLNNIFAELVREAGDRRNANALVGGFVCPGNGDLTSWARGGVLFLEAVLTVRNGAPNSHEDFGWQPLTDAMLRVARAESERRAVVYMLWGRAAQEKEALVLGHEAGAVRPPSSNVQVLKSRHPSPLTTGFVGNGHFASANRFLTDNGREPIVWRLPGKTARSSSPHTCEEVTR